MTPFAFNVLLAVIWTALTGRLDLVNFGLGMAFGALALFLSRGIWGGTGYFRRIGRSLSLLAWSLEELILGALVEAAGTLRIGRPKPSLRVEIPLTIDRDSEIALLASLISLSPGTLVIGVTPDRAKLIVKTTPRRRAALEARVKRILERHILEVMR
jgi:multicomponent Na+:H+ antiporter subunit E